MKNGANGWWRGVPFNFEMVLFESTHGDVLNIRRND
jgi:hypothetical protein